VRAGSARGLYATLAAVVVLCALGTAACAAAAAAPRASAAGAPCPNETLLPAAGDENAVDRATLCLVNAIRSAHHLHALRANSSLGKVAQSQVSSMIRWDYFADVRPTGQTPLSLVGVTRYPAHTAGFAVGQNIAWGTGAYASPAHIVAEWMASPPHRAIILTGAYRDAGIAVQPAVPSVLRAGHSGATYAMEFGARRF
jgi:uncharacterized protein YkwD